MVGVWARVADGAGTPLMKQQYQPRQRQTVVDLEIKGLRRRRTLLPREMGSWFVDFSPMRAFNVYLFRLLSVSLRYATTMPRPIRVQPSQAALSTAPIWVACYGGMDIIPQHS